MSSIFQLDVSSIKMTFVLRFMEAELGCQKSRLENILIEVAVKNIPNP